MLNKDQLRKKYFSIRKKRYYEIKSNFFNPLIQILKKKLKRGLTYRVITQLHLK